MNRKILLYAFLPIVLGAFSWLLWPLESPEFAIEYASTEPTRVTAVKNIQDTAKRPNIIILMADDLGQTDISRYGSELIRTRHIDRIGEEGITFSEGYITSPICSPSRAGLITGRYQQRFGFEFQPHDIYLSNRLQYYGFKWFVDSDPWTPVYMDAVPKQEDRHKQGLPPSEITIGELFGAYGYATAVIGKWHLGYADFALPCNRGFDYHYGFYESHSLFAPEDAPGIVNQHVAEDWTDSYIWGSGREGPFAINRNCEQIEEPAYLTQRIAEESVQFIEKNKDQPFLLYVPFNAPHTPLQAPEYYYAQFEHIEDPYRRIYNAMIASLDDAVGTITERLEALDLMENTLIFFLSDNGGATYTLTTDNAPFKGGKITNFEGGLRVPFLMQWKGHLPAGLRYEHPVSSLDIFATAAAAAGIPLPDERPYDGVNLLPYLTGTKSGAPHEALYWQMGFAKAIRKGDWKMLLNDHQHDTILYNMQEDPYEHRDLYRQHPAVVRRLSKAHEQWAGQMADPLWPGMIYFEFRDEQGRYVFED